jgi:hypothetical protein
MGCSFAWIMDQLVNEQTVPGIHPVRLSDGRHAWQTGHSDGNQTSVVPVLCCTCRFVADPVPMATCIPPNETYPYARWDTDPTGICRDSELLHLSVMQQHVQCDRLHIL